MIQVRKRKPPTLTSKRQFVGVHLSQQAVDYLSLYGLSKKTSKSKIIRKLTEDWCDRHINQSGDLIKDLVFDYVMEAQTEWERQRVVYQYKWKDDISSAFRLYKINLTVKLENKGVSEEYIEQIIGGLTNETEDKTGE